MIFSCMTLTFTQLSIYAILFSFKKGITLFYCSIGFYSVFFFLDYRVLPGFLASTVRLHPPPLIFIGQPSVSKRNRVIPSFTEFFSATRHRHRRRSDTTESPLGWKMSEIR